MGPALRACAAGRGDPEAAPRAGRLDAGRREAGGEGGRRKRTEKFAQEGAAYSRLALRRAKAAGLGAGPPSVPGNLPGCSSPKPKHCPLQEGGCGVPSGRALVTQQVDLREGAFGLQELGCKIRVNAVSIYLGWGGMPGTHTGVAL